MNDPDRDSQPDSPEISDDAALDARLDALGKSLADRQGEAVDDRREGSRTDAQGYGLGIRVVTDIVAGTLMGGGLGWLADSLFGTSPWGFVILLMLGAAAGILLALRSAGMVNEPTMRTRSADENEQGRMG